MKIRNCVLILMVFPGALACVTGAAPDGVVSPQWPPRNIASPGVVQWVDEFSEFEAGGISRFFQAVAGLEGGPGGQRLGRPLAVAGHKGMVAVADFWLGELVLCKYDGSAARILNIPDGVRPNSVAFLSNESSVLVGDGVTGAIFIVEPDGGKPRTLVEGGVLVRCGGLVVSGSGRIIVTDPVAGRVVSFSSDGEIIHSVGGPEGPSAGAFNTPTALAEDPDGSLWMVDTFNHRIVHLSPKLEILGSFGSHGDASGDFALPKGIAVDPDGHIYVSDAVFDVIQVFDSNGRLLLVIGGHGTGRGEFLNPAGLAFTADGTLLVADSGNRRVQVMEYRSREVER